MTSAEITGWLAYLQVDDEVQTQRDIYAIVKAFSGGKDQRQKSKPEPEDEEVIDTTDPAFAEHFKGFSYGNQQPPRRPTRQTSTEILFG